uniref:Uncharacterized protein n=1 Tax=Rhipicephalus zambeziensis TaxID=60191 RepID=A0A224Y6U3_9ACAR
MWNVFSSPHYIYKFYIPPCQTTRRVHTNQVHHLHLREEKKKSVASSKSHNTPLHKMQAFLQSCMHPHTLQNIFFPKEITKVGKKNCILNTCKGTETVSFAFFSCFVLFPPRET